MTVVTSDIICWQERPNKERCAGRKDKQPTQKKRMRRCRDPKRRAFHMQTQIRVLYLNKTKTVVALIKEVCLVQRCFYLSKSYGYQADQDTPDSVQ